MSYQIKSTPFFRRMVSTSKQNGQLQKLKDEYERLKEFNDHALEVRIKQVRLKRLFQEIEQIKELEIRKRRLAQERAREKAALLESQKNNIHEQRIREFMRNQSLTANAVHHQSTRPSTQRKLQRSKASNLSTGERLLESSRKTRQMDNEEESKARVMRRLNYGNQISSWNMQKMLTTNLNREMNNGFYDRRYRKASKRIVVPQNSESMMNLKRNVKPKKKKKEVEKQKKDDVDVCVRERKGHSKQMSYNHNKSTTINNTNTYNLRTRKDNRRRTTVVNRINIQHDVRVEGGGVKEVNRKKKMAKVRVTQPIDDMSSSEQLIRVENSGSYSSDHGDVFEQEKLLSDNETEGAQNARRLWRKLALMLQKRQHNNEHFQRALETLQKCSSDLEFQLRSISNATNLPDSVIPTSRLNTAQGMENDDDTTTTTTTDSDCMPDDDVLVNSEKYVLEPITTSTKEEVTKTDLTLESIPSTSAAASAVLVPESTDTTEKCVKASFILDPINVESLNEQVQTMINKYLPFSMDAVKAEIADYSSKRLRQVFEEQYKFN